MILNYSNWKSPIGNIHLVSNEQKVLALAFDDNWLKVQSALLRRFKDCDLKKKTSEPIQQAIEELKEYFVGKRKTFSVRVELSGTDFQIKAWRALQKIPFGKTKTYGEQASSIGKAKAIRAIGAANGRNLISIIVPCHRVVGASGDLTGYAGGMKTKKKLLQIEGAFQRLNLD